MWSIVLVGLVVGTGWWIKHKVAIWYQSLPKRRALASTARADVKEENKRRLLVRIHSALPERIIRRILRWTPESGRRPEVRISRSGIFRWERISPAQHVAAIGMTGSGKSSALRVLGAWALRNPEWTLEAWDGKWGASVRPYKGKCPVLTTMPEIEARLQDLVDRELPMRADTPEPSHLAIIMDESRLLNMLSDTGMKNLITVIQTGRELGVHLWFGIQDPKTSSIPSELRDQFSAKVICLLQTQEAAQVALKELVTAGWEPHKLMRSGQMLVWTPVKAQKPGRVSFGIWLSPAALAAITPVGPFRDPAFAPKVVLTKASVRPPVPAFSKAPARPDGRTDRQKAALMELAVKPLNPNELGRALDVGRNRAHDVLQQLVGHGDVLQLEDGRYALNTEARS